MRTTFICILCKRSFDEIDQKPICEECLDNLLQEKIEIPPNEEDLILNKKIGIGEKFQAEIPDISKKTHSKYTSHKDNLYANYQFIEMNSIKKVIPETKLIFFKQNLQKLFFKRKKMTDEKIFYILTIFDFEVDKCLLYLNNHQKAWSAFFNRFEP